MRILTINSKKVTIFISFIILFNLSLNFISTESKAYTTALEVEWSVTIDVDGLGGYSDFILFGEAPDAHDGSPKDSYDIQKAPTGFPPYLRAWFDDNLPNPYTQLFDDFRSYPDTYKVWNLTVQWVPSDSTSPNNVTLTWNPADILQSEYNSVMLDGVNMLTQSSYTFTASAMTPYEFEIVCSGVQNNPPNEPTTPAPENNAENISTRPSLSVLVSDPDDDMLTVVFYNASNDSPIQTLNNVESGTRAEITWPDLSYNKTYSWYLEVSDSEYTEISDTWSFTTEKKTNQAPEITIIKPVENSLYIFNSKLLRFPLGTLIIGKIDIEAEATDDVEVASIQLFIGDEKVAEEDSNSIQYSWTDKTFGRKKITVKAYDNTGKTSAKELFVSKFF